MFCDHFFFYQKYCIAKSPDYRLNIVYRDNPDEVTGDMTDGLEQVGVLEYAVSRIPGITSAEYLTIAEALYPGLGDLSLSMSALDDEFRLSEHHIYGSSRLGVQRYNMAGNRVREGKLTKWDMNVPTAWYSYSYCDLVDKDKKVPYGNTHNTILGLSRTLGSRYYELTDHLGNVVATVLDRRTAVLMARHDGGKAIDYYKADVVSASDYYPGGMLMPGRSVSKGDYRFGFNGKMKDDEVKGTGNSLDFGARIYDPRLGRWLSTDPLANKYPAISPFVFSLNTPIMAKDPDGNVVIFINGQHAGTGGTAAYWGGYDKDVMRAVGDKSARYVDGALGGWKNTGRNAGVGAFAGSRGGWIGSLVGAALKVGTSSNVNMKVRIAAGTAQGMKDAADIIANLKEGETIKIVTHSMGTAFARGYTEGILKYAKAHGLVDKVKFEYELDVNSFQGGDLPADKNVANTQNKTGGLDGGKSFTEAVQGNSVPTVGQVPNAEDTTDPSDANKGHAVDQMSRSGIPNLGNGGNAVSVEQGSNNEKEP